MILYTKPSCPLCMVVKTKFRQFGIEFTECQDENKMEELKIDRLPVLETDGKLLEFNDIIKALKEGAI